MDRIYVEIWSCIRIKGESNWYKPLYPHPSSPYNTNTSHTLTDSMFSTDHFKAVSLLKLVFVRAWVVSYVAFFLLLFVPYLSITKTYLFKYTENFTTIKLKFSDKNSDIFHINTQNMDCRYSLEPPRRGGSNEYPQSMFMSRNKANNVYPFKPQFYYIKVGAKGIKII